MTKSKTDSSKKREKKAETIDAEYIKKGAKKVTDKEVEKVNTQQRRLKTSSNQASASEDTSKARLMLSLIKDYWRGDYRKTLWFTIAAIVFVLLYVLNPLDLIPDFIPFVGFVDDVLAFSVALQARREDLKRYKEWKLLQEY